MNDGVTKNTGNSRYLRGAGWPATYEEFRQLAAAGKLPFDLAGINPAGWAVIGDALNKANLLPDDVCDALGLSHQTAIPADALRYFTQDLQKYGGTLRDVTTQDRLMPVFVSTASNGRIVAHQERAALPTRDGSKYVTVDIANSTLTVKLYRTKGFELIDQAVVQTTVPATEKTKASVLILTNDYIVVKVKFEDVGSYTAPHNIFCFAISDNEITFKARHNIACYDVVIGRQMSPIMISSASSTLSFVVNTENRNAKVYCITKATGQIKYITDNISTYNGNPTIVMSCNGTTVCVESYGNATASFFDTSGKLITTSGLGYETRWGEPVMQTPDGTSFIVGGRGGNSNGTDYTMKYNFLTRSWTKSYVAGGTSYYVQAVDEQSFICQFSNGLRRLDYDLIDLGEGESYSRSVLAGEGIVIGPLSGNFDVPQSDRNHLLDFNVLAADVSQLKGFLRWGETGLWPRT